MALDMDFSKLEPHDVLDLAIFAEQEAQEQYEHFATVMDTHGNGDIADFFRKMARREQLHQEQIAERRRSLYPNAVANLANRALWGVETPRDAKGDSAMRPAHAFRVAMEAEKNAETYYTAALQQVTQPQVAQLFESLRQAEIEHQRMLHLEMAKQVS